MLEYAGLGQIGASPVGSNEQFVFMDPGEFSRWRRKLFVKEGLAHYANEEQYVDRCGIEYVRRQAT